MQNVTDDRRQEDDTLCQWRNRKYGRPKISVHDKLSLVYNIYWYVAALMLSECFQRFTVRFPLL